MKKILLIFLLLNSGWNLSACEICGCGVGNYYFGLLPQFNHKFFGLRYRYMNYHTQIANEPSEFSRDHYQIIEAWAGWNIGKRWQIMGVLPYQVNHQVSDAGTVNLHGLGDVLLMGSYKLLDLTTHDGKQRAVGQQLWVGTGLKIPTGKFAIDPDDPDINSVANTQQGSGSLDFLFNVIHHLNAGSFGLNTQVNYKLNTTNKDQYRFGNRFSAGTIGYYAISLGNTVVSPNLGILYEHSSPSSNNKNLISDTGGYALNGTAGIELNLNRWMLGANFQLPMAQNFAHGQTTMNNRGMVYLSLVL